MAKGKIYYDVTDDTLSDFLSRLLGGGGHQWLDQKTVQELRRKDPSIRVIATKRYGENPFRRTKRSR